MDVLVYDLEFDGFLSLIFDMFERRLSPDLILGPEDPPPLIADRVHLVATEAAKAERVWAGLKKRLSPLGLKQWASAWLTGEPGAAELAARYVRAVLRGVSETDFSRPEILGVSRLARKVSQEKERVRQFVRFQKTADGLFFAAVAPDYNVTPLVLGHFRDRFGDQRWLIYDLVRSFGFYHCRGQIEAVDEPPPLDRRTGRLAPGLLAEDELLYQEAWRTYFQAVSIAERANPRLQRRFMPRRYWPYLLEIAPEAKPAIL